MVNPKFKAIYNIFTKELAVLYGNCVSRYVFQDTEEWTKVSFNGDQEHPNYLHIQIDYDETFQLLFYPRQDKDNSLHESQSTCFNSGQMNKINKQLKILFNDVEFNKELKELVKISKGNETWVESGL